MASVWDQRKEQVRRALAEDYPAALARRKAAFPDIDDILAFPRTYLQNSSVHDPEARRHKNEQYGLFGVKMETSFVYQAQMHLYAAYGRALSDNTPVGGSLTVQDLARQELSHQPTFEWFRDTITNIEQTMFNDEKAARRVQAITSSTELISYLQGAQARYQATTVQMIENAGYDAQSRDFLLDQYRMEVAERITKFYDKQTWEEVNAVMMNYYSLSANMDETLLADSSRDDAESRRLLTEFRDMQFLQQRSAGGK